MVKKTKILYFEDAIEQLCHEVPLDFLPVKLVGNCWGLSKMTVTNDIKLRKLYYEAPFVEYLNFSPGSPSSNSRMARTKMRHLLKKSNYS